MGISHKGILWFVACFALTFIIGFVLSVRATVKTNNESFNTIRDTCVDIQEYLETDWGTSLTPEADATLTDMLSRFQPVCGRVGGLSTEADG